ncbi:hypothetical protein ACFU7Y_02800 [Kitasatospora sp. NPDC057542]|uniref:hypothetical protein n=1 Tax=Kitasatospora sp. NPDC057542 TaxID=3346162 RepID=UPI0036745D70
MTPQLNADSTETALRRTFGNGFVDWILATDENTPLTSSQEEVAVILHRESNAAIPPGTQVPAYLRLLHLQGLDQQTQKPILLQLRSLAGGTDTVLPEPSGDPVLDALHAWTAENFGALLLGSHGAGIGWGTPSMNRLARAVAADPALPFDVNSSPEDVLYLANSLGGGSGLQSAVVGPAVAQAAYRRAAAAEPTPQIGDVFAELPKALDAAREVCAGRTVETLALAGLTGVLLPEGMSELTAPWGRVRVAHDSDNPMASRQALTLAMEDGTQLVSSDSGDLTVETTAPWSAEITALPSADDLPPSKPSTGYAVLERRLEETRLALALAIGGEQVPVLLPTWLHLEDPLSAMTTYSLTQLAAFRQRTPTRLTTEQAKDWEQWIDLLNGLPLDNLGQAPRRLLRAITERQDPVDALVDAVIAWEAIFGTSTEITFRVCASLARLLHTSVDERTEFLKSAKKVYNARSKIVHGTSEVKIDEVHRLRDQAVSVAVDAFRALVVDRRDLLSIPNSDKRSERIMLE